MRPTSFATETRSLFVNARTRSAFSISTTFPRIIDAAGAVWPDAVTEQKPGHSTNARPNLNAPPSPNIAASDEELVKGVGEIGAAEVIFAAPEGAACLPTLRRLIDQAEMKEDETVVLFNTGSGIKYLETFR